MTAIIIDDKPANIQTLTQLLAEYAPQIQVTGSATNIDDGYNAITNLKPTLVFLDIEMPGGSGFELLKKFTRINFEVIFVTAYNQYAVQAFRENALDYLLKPVDIDALQEAVAKTEKQISLKQTQQNLTRYLQQVTVSTPLKISLPVQDGYLFINADDVIRCEASGSYSWLYLLDGRKVMVSMRLKECEDILPANQFYRIHNSHIINLKQINKYIKGRGGSMLMQDGSMVEVSVSKKAELLELIHNQFKK